MKKFNSKHIFIILILTFANICLSGQSTDSLQIPFFERFSNGSFLINNWDVDNAWEISQAHGIPRPSANFAEAISGLYYRSITSNWICKEETTSGDYLVLEFGFKGASTCTDTLIVEISDTTGWHCLGKYSNPSGEWVNKKLNINSFITNNCFKIRFSIAGKNSTPQNQWKIDNISVVEDLEYPTELQAEYFWSSGDFGAKINWYQESPILDNCFSGCPQSWSWEYDPETGVGTTDGSTFSYAAVVNKFFPGSSYLTGLKTYFYDNAFDSITLNVWQGENGEQLVLSQKYTQVQSGEFLSFCILPSVYIVDSVNTIVGITIYGQEVGTYPAALAEGTAHSCKGDLIKLGDEEWDCISDFGPDYNHDWVLSFYFGDNVNEQSLKGFNVYKREDCWSDEFELLEFVESESVDDSAVFFDVFSGIGDPYCEENSYKVKTVWEYFDNGAIVERESIAPYFENTDINYVSVIITGLINEEESNVIAYPNPASTHIIIKPNINTKKLSLFDLNGRLVLTAENTHKLNLNFFEKGIYLLKIEDGKEIIIQKIVIN